MFNQKRRPSVQCLFDLDLGSCELLEARELMAGDVQASITSDGSLKLNGDNANNRLTFGKLGNGELVVIGLDGTKLNGQTTFFTGVTSIEGDLKANLKGGSNLLRVKGIHVHGDLNVRSKGGHDTVGIISSQIDGRTVAKLGKGDDMWVVSKSTLGGKVSVNTQSGDDILFVTPSNTIQADVLLRMAGGIDNAYLTGSFTGELVVKMGADRDAILTSNLSPGVPATFEMGGGNDTVFMATSQPFSLHVNGGGSEDGYVSQVGNPINAQLTSVEHTILDNTELDVLAVTAAVTLDQLYVDRGGQVGDLF